MEQDRSPCAFPHPEPAQAINNWQHLQMYVCFITSQAVMLVGHTGGWCTEHDGGGLGHKHWAQLDRGAYWGKNARLLL